MITSTPSVRKKLQTLFDKKELEFLSNNEFESNEDALRVWTRYLINLGIVLKKRKNTINIKDGFSRSLSIPKELAEKILILNTAPPLPPIHTLQDLVVRKLVKEYRMGIHNICVSSEIITDEYLLLFHGQTNYEDYETRKGAIHKAEVCVALKNKVLEINKNEAKIEHYQDRFITLIYKNDI